MKAKHRYLITTIDADAFVDDVDKKSIKEVKLEGGERYSLDLSKTKEYTDDASRKTIPDNIVFSQLLREKLRRSCVCKKIIEDNENADDEIIGILQALTYKIFSTDSGFEIFDSQLFLSLAEENEDYHKAIEKEKRRHLVKCIETVAEEDNYFADDTRKKQAVEVLLDLVKEGYAELFIRDIVFVNFDKVKSGLHKEDEEKTKICKKLFSGGFDMTFTDYSDPKKSVVIHYVRFEKSNSMSKNSTIAFIRSDYEKALGRRIKLGLELKSCYISKFHAYKGLCFSSGVRVDPSELPMAEYRLVDNQKVLVPHIIVVNDIAHTATNIVCKDLTKSPKDKQPKNGIETAWDLTEKHIKESQKVILDDGAGFISKDYAKKLAKAIGAKGEAAATSFQFRIPFGKGVLHGVDFHGFFNEIVHGTKIKDAFGVTHNIDDVHIILTRSQFKAFNWFMMTSAKTEEGAAKVWENYLIHYLNYGHAFYVVNTNPIDRKKPMVTKLNYQILHTLPINAEGFKSIVDDSIDNYRMLKKDLNAQLVEYLDLSEKVKEVEYIDYEENVGENDHTDSAEQNSEEKRPEKPSAIKSVLEKEPRLIGMPYFSSQLRDIANSKRRDYLIGRLLIKGRLKMMAPDLLYLLYRIARDNCCCYTGDHDSAKLKKWWNTGEGASEHLHEQSFYSPVGEFKDGNEYALFRNPHISRNEHSVAQAYIPDPQSVRARYFGHLQGVAMINPAGLIQERLQGADYDGDIMRIIDNEHYVRAAKEASQLPLLLMPVIESKEKMITDENEWNTVIATFTNRVGKVSNCAFTNAVNAYNENSDLNSEARDNAAKTVEKLAILTGLEIDSAKNGFRPLIPLNELNVSTNRYFIELKNVIKKNEYKQKDLENMLRPVEENAANINNLPYMVYHSTIMKAKKSSREAENNIFNFKNVSINSDIEHKISSLLTAYINVIKNIGSASYASKRSNVDYGDSIYQILIRQHDDAVAHNLYKRLKAMFVLCSDNLVLISMYHDAISHEWVFSNREDRRERLKEILAKAGVDSTDDISAALCDFRSKGYDLLAYAIQYRLGEIAKESVSTVGDSPEKKARDKMEFKRAALGLFFNREQIVDNESEMNNDGIDSLFDDFCVNYDCFGKQLSKAVRGKDFQKAKRLLEKANLPECALDIMNSLADKKAEKFIVAIRDYAEARGKLKQIEASDELSDKELVNYYMRQMAGFVSNKADWIRRLDSKSDAFEKAIEKEVEKKHHFGLVFSDSPTYLKREYAKNYFRRTALEICGNDESLVVYYLMQTKSDSPAREYVWDMFHDGINSVVENNLMLDLPVHSDDGSMTYEFENFRVCAAMEEDFASDFTSEDDFDEEQDFSFI